MDLQGGSNFWRDANGTSSVISEVHMMVCKISGRFTPIWVVPQEFYKLLSLCRVRLCCPKIKPKQNLKKYKKGVSTHQLNISAKI